MARQGNSHLNERRCAPDENCVVPGPKYLDKRTHMNPEAVEDAQRPQTTRPIFPDPTRAMVDSQIRLLVAQRSGKVAELPFGIPRRKLEHHQDLLHWEPHSLGASPRPYCRGTSRAP